MSKFLAALMAAVFSVVTVAPVFAAEKKEEKTEKKADEKKKDGKKGDGKKKEEKKS